MEGGSVISQEVVARYAGDAACEVDGVTRVVAGVRRGIRVEDGTIEIHLALRFGVSIPRVGAEVQANVAAYLEQMPDERPRAVNVVVDEVDVLP